MARSKFSKGSTERENWNKAFNAMVHMLNNQQTQLQSLVKDRKLLQDRIKLQHERWVFDVEFLQEHISQMKIDLIMQGMAHMVEATKADLVMGLKNREAVVYQHKFENADSELADFREWFQYLSHKGSGEKDISSEESKNGEEHQYEALESEMRRLKCENEKLKDKNTEVSSLLAEKNFVWNQFKQMEANLNEQLRRKRADVESANQKIQALLSSMEELQSFHSLKDKMIDTLKFDMTKLKSDSDKKDKEISRLCRELEALRKSRNDSVNPVLSPCAKSGNTQSRGKSGRTIAVKKESDSSHAFDKGSKSLKRKAVEIIDISDTPKLFTSSFKVPKMKSSSPAVR